MLLPPCRRRLLLGACLLVASGLARRGAAVVPHDPGLAQAAEVLLAARPVAGVDVDDAATAAWAASDPAWRSFLAAHPGTWHPRFDRRSGRLSFAWGEGFAWLPADLHAETDDEQAQALDRLEARARQFMAENAGLYRIPPAVDLVRDASRSGLLDGGRVMYLRLRAEVCGVPVDGAGAYFHLNHGRVVQFGIGAITDDLGAAPTTPVVTVRGADDRARTALAQVTGIEGAPSTIAAVDEARTYLLPVVSDDGAEELAYRLVHERSYRVAGRPETWTIVHDAISGERVAFFDRNAYDCPPPTRQVAHVTGGVLLGPVEEVGESVRPMPFASVTNGGPRVTDANGAFPYAAGQPASTSLSGQFFDLTCNGCTNPPQAAGFVPDFADVELGTGGVNEVGNGVSTLAERNAFYHLNLGRSLAAGHLADTQVGGFFSRTTPALVNDFASCNAYWDGNGVNFFRADASCNNMAEVSDVVLHEWGHGLDQFTGGARDGARGEGFADIVAFLALHDPRFGPYFFRGNALGIRSADEATGLYTRTNLGGLCPGGGGPLGYEVHCEGVLHSQTWWRLASNLRTKYGDVFGWYQAQRLFFGHLLVSHWSVYQGLPPGEVAQYDGVVLVDDDDGNLANGVPDGDEINDAFTHHETAGSPLVADSPDCTPPGTPAVTLLPGIETSSGHWQVRVAWTAVPGVAQYEVLRNERDPDAAYVLVGRVAAPTTEIVDPYVREGFEYSYRVQAITGADCRDIGDNRRSVILSPVAPLVLDGFDVDDAAGNGNGTPEPGETLALSVTLRNDNTVDATGVVATLGCTEPGVAILDAVADVGDVPAGATRSTQAPHFTVALDRTLVSCGTTIPFTVAVEGGLGCSGGSFDLVVGLQGAYVVAWSDDFETDRAWRRVPPPSPPEAAAGGWSRGDPVATIAQLEDDHTPDPGVNCWVTGLPGGAASANDVDAGCTTLQSPVIDLGGRSGLLLDYWLSCYLGTAPDDRVVVEISNDGGGAWTEVETILDSIPAWERRTFALDDILGAPAARLRLRVTTCDLGVGSVVEAMFDDVRIGRPNWTCENPDPRPRLALVSHSVLDEPATGGIGNGDGVVDPGETVRLPIRIVNEGDVLATNVRGTLTLGAAPAGVSLTDDTSTWPDVDVALEEETDGSPAHFELALTLDVPCGSLVPLSLHLEYDGPRGSYAEDHDLSLDVGCNAWDPNACRSPPLPLAVGPWLRATENHDLSHAELSWAGAVLGDRESFLLERTTRFRPAPAWTTLTPPDFAGTTFDDTTVAGPLHFYRVVLLNCLGERGPDEP